MKQLLKTRIGRWFKYDHLPTDLQPISRQFHDLADWVVKTIPNGPERTVCLRKILEAKDCAVRADIEGKSPID